MSKEEQSYCLEDEVEEINDIVNEMKRARGGSATCVHYCTESIKEEDVDKTEIAVKHTDIGPFCPKIEGQAMSDNTIPEPERELDPICPVCGSKNNICIANITARYSYLSSIWEYKDGEHSYKVTYDDDGPVFEEYVQCNHCGAKWPDLDSFMEAMVQEEEE